MGCCWSEIKLGHQVLRSSITLFIGERTQKRRASGKFVGGDGECSFVNLRNCFVLSFETSLWSVFPLFCCVCKVCGKQWRDVQCNVHLVELLIIDGFAVINYTTNSKNTAQKIIITLFAHGVFFVIHYVQNISYKKFRRT